MIAIARLTGGASAGDYYLERSADCTVEYYAGGREPSGVWCGSGAAPVGLTGPVVGEGREVFTALLGGRTPDGVQVARPVMRPDPRGLLPARPLVEAVRAQAAGHGLEPVEVFDSAAARDRYAELARDVDASTRRSEVAVDVRAAGELAAAAALDPAQVFRSEDGADRYAAALPHAGKKSDHRRAALDVVMSPPKSVSVLHAFGDDGVRGQVGFAQDAAVREALAYLERHTAQAVRGHQGKGQPARRISTDGFVAAAFTHHTSRADDPQLHTHVVIANLLRGVDGRWSAVDSWPLYRQARTAGAVYQAVLRGELTRRLGVEWEPVYKSVAEVAGIPGAVCREFSTRNGSIHEECEQGGSDSRAARQRAAYRTRPAKSHRSREDLRLGWEQRVRDLGYDPAAMVTDALGRTVPPPDLDLESLAQRLYGPDGLTRHRTSFIRRDVTRELADAVSTGTPVTTDLLERLTDRLLDHADAIPLDTPAGNGERQWTTADLLATERAALDHADRISTAVRDIDTHRVTDIVTAAPLNAWQRRVAVNLALGWSPVQVVVGPAGSGKTTVLATAAQCWQIEGRPVFGTALAATTADRLQETTGIPSQSLARLLATADRLDPATGRPRGLPPEVVVVVDEASMVGTRQLARLLDHVAAADGQTVLVGDPAQLPEVEAGGLFTAFAQRALGVHVLSGNARQVHDWERDALTALRNGHVDAALDQYLAHDRVHLLPTPVELAEQIATDYAACREQHGPYGVIALASRRADVHRLNSAIRERLQAGGAVGADVVTVTGPDRHPTPLAVGDLLMVTRNDPATGLRNGTRAQLTDADDKKLTLHTETGRQVTVPTGWATGRLTHAYALTVHKAQGLTTVECLLYGTSALCHQAGYVALSRGRESNHLYSTLSGLDADQTPDQPGFQLLGGPDPAHVLDAVADRLEHADTHTLASNQGPVVRDDHLLRTLIDPDDRGHGIEL